MPKMTGSRYFAEAMRGYGVSNVFYVNSVARGALEEMGKLGVKTVVCHGEKAAAYMADGYARATHQPGICLCQDIGTTNLAAGLRDARMSGSPVIAITGGQNDEPRYRHAYQNAEDNSAWEGVTKANFYVERGEALPRPPAAGVPHRHRRRARPGSPGIARQCRAGAGRTRAISTSSSRSASRSTRRFVPRRSPKR